MTAITRLAPSPTGALHLGNLRTFAISWALARQENWRVILRMEDLDGPRIKRDSIAETIDVLSWLGFRWDEGPYRQSQDLTPYHHALGQLAESGKIYPCWCSRKQLLAASLSAPHGDDHEQRYPGTCRPAMATPISPALLHELDCGWRFRVPDRAITVRDQFAGEQTWNVDQLVGDFLVATKGGLPSYQLAVVIDDARQQVDRIVRGDDLFSSAPRQWLLYDTLNLTPRPDYWHIPLVRGPDGRRLAKRHGDTRITSFRDQGVPAERLIALMARWCGLAADSGLMSLAQFADRFDLARLPTTAVTFSPRDAEWLVGR